jgi:hypothetical protein
MKNYLLGTLVFAAPLVFMLCKALEMLREVQA